MLLVKLSLLSYLFTCSYAARILAVVFIPSLSHNLVFRPIYRELSLRGHQVVAVAPNPLNDSTLTNLTEIDVSYVYERNKNMQSALNFDSYTEFWTNTFQWMMLPAEDILKDSRVQRLCEGGEKFDLVLLEALLPVFYAFGTKCDAPTVGMISMDGLLSTHSIQGSVIHPILFDDMLLPYQKPLGLVEKILYVYSFLWYKWYYNYRVVPQCDSMMRKYLGQHLPPLDEIEVNSSMAFINTNVVMNPIRPLSPTVVPMGFVQIRAPNALSQDLQSVLDNAKEGAVYFSFGSNTKSSHLSPLMRSVIIKTFEELPYTVLCKWETDGVPSSKRNLVVKKWFPQADILAHPNVKVFITHAGLQSIEESIVRGVPMVAVPLFGDQKMNAEKSAKLEIAIQLDKDTLSRDSFKSAIIEVAENKRYRDRVRELKSIVEDQPMTGLERAVWWSEYVIRHRGARHLRSAVADVSLAEYLLLDVLAAVLSVLLIAGIVSYKLARLVGKLTLCGWRRNKAKES
ncbi:UDP-glycosyltransferase UGT5-like [Cylas formicarius]|uniref:UDP-glycosyltransferase UGT5-like n=1 Tax=Cylas formicarius TaxID=197179 RepID=UPI002958CAC2|nr:UDP-glycosyltransferase UGT5-like [Cylas formicarius]XP_060535999.1 UDP-glycosyltransferase UGT5-like [Cylas formicarius]XP_060536000.1 UDP-glycosyltransferase UGT5-like [Cylas formicarius]XP_060536002.1 UDP-glycosyltransferase UGT5-like [Cylas formicarius]